MDQNRRPFGIEESERGRQRNERWFERNQRRVIANRSKRSGYAPLV
jgi:hypothetical protein